MIENPVILVITYNRPHSLRRLLNSLANAVYQQQQVRLIISIDKSESSLCKQIAEEFNWLFGPKEIIEQATHLGLKEHVLTGGDLVLKHESLIILEDDLYVSPYFYTYACLANDFYKSDEHVAGISLYNYQVSESSFSQFQAIDDASDVYFIQVASSWGQLFSKKQWINFRNWLKNNPELIADSNLPAYLFEWGQHSWKKHFIHYLIDTNSFFVFPRLSLTTNFEEPGTNAVSKGLFQVPIQVSQKEYRFKPLNDSGAKYDAWFELFPESINRHTTQLNKYDYEVNLYHSKSLQTIKKKYVLTTLPNDKALVQFSSELVPLELNVINDLKGVSIGLYETKHVINSNPSFEYKKALKSDSTAQGTSFTIIVIVQDFHPNDFTHSIHSILNQSHSNFDILISSCKKYYSEIEKAISYTTIKCRILLREDTSNFNQLLKSGIENATGNYVCWIKQGTSLLHNSLILVNLALEQHPLTNWIRGIDENYQHKEEFNTVNTFRYRIQVNDLIRRLEEGDLDISTELHFFNRLCLKDSHLNELSELELLSTLLNHYQLTVVILNLGIKQTPNQQKPDHDTKRFLKLKYDPVQTRWSLKRKLLYPFIQSQGFNKNAWQWYLSSLLNYPDVLRFDEKHQSFYYNKF